MQFADKGKDFYSLYQNGKNNYQKLKLVFTTLGSQKQGGSSPTQ